MDDKLPLSASVLFGSIDEHNNHDYLTLSEKGQGALHPEGGIKFSRVSRGYSAKGLCKATVMSLGRVLLWQKWIRA